MAYRRTKPLEYEDQDHILNARAERAAEKKEIAKGIPKPGDIAGQMTVGGVPGSDSFTAPGLPDLFDKALLENARKERRRLRGLNGIPTTFASGRRGVGGLGSLVSSLITRLAGRT